MACQSCLLLQRLSPCCLARAIDKANAWESIKALLIHPTVYFIRDDN